MRWCLVVLLAACSSSAPGGGARSVSGPNGAAPLRNAAAVPADAAPDAPAIDAAPDAPACPMKPRPAGCPAQEPNVNHPCSVKGVECTYAPGCCPIVYVCDKTGHFEARFSRCE